MARIAGVDLPSNKRVEIGLTYIYGIGDSTAVEILDRAKIDHARRVARDTVRYGEVGRRDLP